MTPTERRRLQNDRIQNDRIQNDRLQKTARQEKNEKSKALDLAIASIEKQFGRGSIMKLGGGKSFYENTPSYSTGSFGLDKALGIGGLPRGRIVEIYGPESSGKTTLALSTAAEAQKQGGTVAFVDAEHALDIAYASKLGVSVKDMLVSQPDTGEQALEITETLVRSGAVDVLIVDSVAALTPKAEIEGDMGDSHMGLQARLMSQALRKLTASIHRSQTLVIFINQIRMKIGVMFGNPETTTGGNALKFYSSVRLDVRRIAALKKGDEIIGNRTLVKVVKNKTAPPFARAEFDLIYSEGISRAGELLDTAVKNDIIDKSGAWFSFQGEKLGQGKEAARQTLKENARLMNTIKNLVFNENNLNKDNLNKNNQSVAAGPAEEGKAKKSLFPQHSLSSRSGAVSGWGEPASGSAATNRGATGRVPSGGPASGAAGAQSPAAEAAMSVNPGGGKTNNNNNVEKRSLPAAFAPSSAGPAAGAPSSLQSSKKAEAGDLKEASKDIPPSPPARP